MLFTMGQFLKCACPHCGQSIEYPAEGTGQIVPCPTCEKPITLVEYKTQREATQAESVAYASRVRSEPATEKQKEKLLWFGCALDEGMTKGQASDAIDQCVRDYPEKERTYYSRPATKEQLAKIREINKKSNRDDELFYDFENDGPLTYGAAKDLIQEWGWAQRRKEREEFDAYSKSDEARIDEAYVRINQYRDTASKKRVAKAWAVAKSRMVDQSQIPNVVELEDTLEELFPRLRPKSRDRITYRCEGCGSIFKVRPPLPSATNVSSFKSFSETDRVPITIQCPGCGGNISAESLLVCKCICPHCSSECVVAKSQIGQSVMHAPNGCMKLFVPTPMQTFILQPIIRLMQYIGEFSKENGDSRAECSEQKDGNTPTEQQLQKVQELELKLDKRAGITSDILATFLALHGQPMRDEDWSVFKKHGITSFTGDAMASYALSVLIKYLEELVQTGNWKNSDDRRIYRSCQVAMLDPAHGSPALILDQFNRVTFEWPKRKLQEWYRKGAEF